MRVLLFCLVATSNAFGFENYGDVEGNKKETDDIMKLIDMMNNVRICI